jgi:hypothetical protein
MAAVDMVVVCQPDVLIGSAQEKFGVNGSLVDEKARALLGRLMTRLVATARAMRQGVGQ